MQANIQPRHRPTPEAALLSGLNGPAGKFSTVWAHTERFSGTGQKRETEILYGLIDRSRSSTIAPVCSRNSGNDHKWPKNAKARLRAFWS